MPEVEAKLRVADPEAIRRRLHDLGAPLESPRVQADLFYAHPQRDFARTDEALRLRFADGFLELTYKGPKQSVAGEPRAGGAEGAAGAADPGAGLKARAELNVPVGADPTALLAALGFRPVALLRKTRASTRLDKCRVELDHVEGLGWFLEVEALVEPAPRAAAAVHATLVRLGLADAPRVQASYLELALAAGAAGVQRLGSEGV